MIKTALERKSVEDVGKADGAQAAEA
jgi:hypothetical protein